MDVQKHIRELLMQQDCVIVPGLGGFITRYKPAMEDMPGKKVLPPSVSISFNRQLNQNDGLLINHISAKTRIPYKLAEEKVEYYVGACKRQLAARGIIIMPDIGKLYNDESGNLNFAPSTGRNYLPEAFGLRPISWYKTYAANIETAATEVVVEEKKLVEISPEKEVTRLKRRKRYRAGITASFAAALVLVILMAQGIYVKPLQLHNLSLFNLDFTDTNNAIAKEQPALHKPVAANIKGGIHSAPTLMPEMDVPHFSDPNRQEGYFLVLGSFDNKEAAEKYIRNQHLDNDLLVLDGGTAKYRVATYVTANTSQAFATRDHFRGNMRPDAWLLYNRH